MSYKERFKEVFQILFVPTSIRPLRFIFLIENILTIYRNFYYFKYPFIISVRIIIEVAACITSLVTFSIYIMPSASQHDIIYFNVAMVTTIITVCLGRYSSKKINKLLSLIENTNSYFSNDMKYQSKMSKRDRLIKLMVVILMSVSLLNNSYWSLRRMGTIKYVSLNVFFTLNLWSCHCRNIFECIVLYTFLYVISQQLECITRVVSKKTQFLAILSEQRNNINIEHCSYIRHEMRDFEELSVVYSNITECSKLFNKIFGLQLLFILGWTAMYYIIVLYTLVATGIDGYQGVYRAVAYVWSLVQGVLLLLLIAQSAQKKLNNVRDLRRQLGKLLISYVDNGAEYKATKSFLGLVSTRCVKTKTYGSIIVDMTLIPSITMFVTSNTVIALQFSNIL